MRWYKLLEQGVDSGTCQPLLDDVKSRTNLLNGPDDAPATAYATLYLGVAEGCLGKAEAASDLNKAKTLLGSLQAKIQSENPEERPPASSVDNTCQPENLLVWAYETYLNTSITITCTPE